MKYCDKRAREIFPDRAGLRSVRTIGDALVTMSKTGETPGRQELLLAAAVEIGLLRNQVRKLRQGK